MKRCGRCKETKQVSEFYPDKHRPDGLRNTCKACVKSQNARFNHSPRGRAYRRNKIREYMASTNGQAKRAAYRASGHFKIREKAYRSAKTAEYKARRAVRTAVTNGTLPDAKNLKCSRCGAQAEHYHHHAGYDPESHLLVTPLCHLCHGAVHRKDRLEESD